MFPTSSKMDVTKAGRCFSSVFAAVKFFPTIQAVPTFSSTFQPWVLPIPCRDQLCTLPMADTSVRHPWHCRRPFHVGDHTGNTQKDVFPLLSAFSTLTEPCIREVLQEIRVATCKSNPFQPQLMKNTYEQHYWQSLSALPWGRWFSWTSLESPRETFCTWLIL